MILKQKNDMKTSEEDIISREKSVRIGNYIQWDDCEEDTVKVIDSISHTINGRPIATLKFIILTDQWLLRFGFVKIKSDSSFDLWARDTKEGSKTSFEIRHYLNGYEYNYGNLKNIFVTVACLQNIFKNATIYELTEAQVVKGKNGNPDTFRPIYRLKV
jgi:hypothetical protein